VLLFLALQGIWPTNTGSCITFCQTKESTLQEWRCRSGYMAMRCMGPTTCPLTQKLQAWQRDGIIFWRYKVGCSSAPHPLVSVYLPNPWPFMVLCFHGKTHGCRDHQEGRGAGALPTIIPTGSLGEFVLPVPTTRLWQPEHQMGNISTVRHKVTGGP